MTSSFSHVFLTILTVATLVFAGCSKPDNKPAETVPSEPVVSDTTGSIAGLVVNEEVVPVPGAQLLVKETEQTTTTAADGRFAINALAPGAYTVFISAIGYEAHSSRLDVVASQITEKTFTLLPVVLKVPYHESIPFAGRFECSAAFVDVLWTECPGADQIGSVSQIDFTKPEGVTYLVAELRWTQASAGTGQNLDFNVVQDGRDESQWYANVFGRAPLKIVIEVGTQYSNPASPGGGVGSSDFDQVVDDEDTALQLDLYSSPVYTDEVLDAGQREALVGLTLQQSFDGIITFFYNEVPPEDFSAFADA